MAFLLQERGKEIRITEDVVIGAASNVGSGAQVMTLLLEKRGEDVAITEAVLLQVKPVEVWMEVVSPAYIVGTAYAASRLLAARWETSVNKYPTLVLGMPFVGIVCSILGVAFSLAFWLVMRAPRNAYRKVSELQRMLREEETTDTFELMKHRGAPEWRY